MWGRNKYSKEPYDKVYLINIIFFQLCKDIIPFTQQDELSALTLTSAPIYLYREKVTLDEFKHLELLWQGGPANFKKVGGHVSLYIFVYLIMCLLMSAEFLMLTCFRGQSN